MSDQPRYVELDAPLSKEVIEWISRVMPEFKAREGQCLLCDETLTIYSADDKPRIVCPRCNEHSRLVH